MTISDKGTLSLVTEVLNEMCDTGISKNTYRLLRKVLVRECGVETVNCVDDYVDYASEEDGVFYSDASADTIMQTCRI